MLNINRLEELRDEKKFTQEELANAIGRSREWYYKMLKSGNLSLSDLKKLCDNLETTPSELLSYEREKTFISAEEEMPGYSKKDVIQDLREQIKLKDDQIKFLQHLIEEKI